MAIAGCHDLDDYATKGGSYQGAVVGGTFVLSGVDPGTTLCMTLDTDHLQTAPGVLSTSDGRFAAAPLRPIPQIWYDPLSTLSFGEGRVKNLVYVVGASTPFADGNGSDVLAVVSLMQSGGVEVRLLRGAPPLSGGDASAEGDAAGGGAVPEQNVFAVFALTRESTPCAY